MTPQEAIELMKTSVDVHDWNQKRDLCRQSLSKENKHIIYSVIDQNGMCPKTIKKNKENETI